MNKKFFKHDPYNWLFFLGFISSVVGVALWVLFGLQVLSVYPINTHSKLMNMGFVFSFVCGFLMTAVPKMTGTNALSIQHYIITLLLQILFLLSVLAGLDGISHIFSILLFANILFFFLSRKLKMKSRQLPSGFIFIPIGIICGFLGQLLIILSSWSAWVSWNFLDDFNLIRLGKLLLYEGFIINLIIGLGSRLIPILSQKVNVSSPAEIDVIDSKIINAEALIFNLSFFVEVYFNDRLGHFIRFAVFIFILAKNFKFFDRSVQPTKLGMGLTICQLFLPLAYLSIALFPNQRAHLIHMVYIGSIALLTYLVSVRVVLAHGGGDITRERTSNYIFTFVSLFVFAVVIRVLTPVIAPDRIIIGFSISAMAFIFGAISWFIFLKKDILKGLLGRSTFRLKE